jgi:hypothetical protein
LREHLWGKTKIATIAVKVTNSIIHENPRIEHIVIRNSSANEKGANRFQIDSYDKFYVPLNFVFSKEYVWKANLLGGGRLTSFIEQFKHYKTISEYFLENEFKAYIGYTRDKYVINDDGQREVGKVVNLKGKKVLHSELFDSDILDESGIKIIEEDDWVRIPKGGFTAPNILIRLNINVNLPIVYNTHDLLIPNGVVTIKAKDHNKLKAFISGFKQNRKLYIFLIKVLSPKTFIQQGGAYSINLQDVSNLPIDTDKDGHIIPFPFLNSQESVLMEETELIIRNLYKSNSDIFKPVTTQEINKYATIFCEILNLTYENDGYKFKTVRQILADNYVWITFEHTNKDPTLQLHLDHRNKREFEKILHDDVTNNYLTINKMIIYYGANNQISFIKSNKLKYWMRNIAYRDVENVKSDLFKSGY